MKHKAVVAARIVYRRLQDEAASEGRGLGQYVAKVRDEVASDPATADLAPWLVADDKAFRRQLNSATYNENRKVRGRPRRALTSASNRKPA